MLFDILPPNCNLPQQGPLLLMTDDNAIEKAALNEVWPQTIQLLRTFHFLQRKWTWLYERIKQSDRAPLLKQVKTLCMPKQMHSSNEI